MNSTLENDRPKETNVIPIYPVHSKTPRKLDALLQDDPVQHLHRLDRSVFTDEQLFELELKYIFEGNWVYLAHESQIPNVNDYLTVYIGRQPVVRGWLLGRLSRRRGQCALAARLRCR